MTAEFFTAERAGFLSRIIAEPDEDTHRLAFADWLEEHDDPRGEFIRVQIRIADIRRDCGCGSCVKLRSGGQHHNGKCGIDERQDDWVRPRHREGELFTASHARGWGLGDGWRHTVHGHTMDPGYGASIPAALFSRGFVSSITCTAAAFLGGPCGRCVVDPRRGYDCAICHGKGEIEGIAAAVFRQHPVTAVTLTDVGMFASTGADYWYVAGVSRFPQEYWSRMDRLKDRAACLKAISEVCVQHGRAKAKEPR